MGGFWLPNLKLLDGVWFGIDDTWIGPGTGTTSGWGYVRTDLPTTEGVEASRTDVVPDGEDGALVGLSLRSGTDRTITLQADAHSELMGSYPWGETDPSQTTENLPDTASVEGGHLLFRDQGTPPHPNADTHDWAATFGSSLAPTATQTGQDHRGRRGSLLGRRGRRRHADQQRAGDQRHRRPGRGEAVGTREEGHELRSSPCDGQGARG